MYYDGNPEYANQKIEDSFLLALADGGFQVGELAKLYFPGGYEVFTHDHDEALFQTNELLKQEQVIIYEAAIRFENLFIRVDVLRKNKTQVELVEVKAKSFDSSEEAAFLNKNGSIAASWRPYLYDVAFQKHVIKSAFPEYEVFAYLMMADKNSLCPTDGLNQKFKIVKDQSGRKRVAVSQTLSTADLSTPVLGRVNVDAYCDLIYNDEFDSESISFADYVNYLADCCMRGEKITSSPSAGCGSCEFQATEKEAEAGLKSGLHECWKERLGWADDDFREPTVLDIWNFRKKDRCIAEGRIKLCALTEADISPRCGDKPGLSASERQWLQVSKAQRNDETHWIDSENLRREMDTWVYPLHFIDFETSMVAIPFNKGRHPYEGVAFQFSHHVVHEDGRIEHCGQYLNTEPGVFPNYDFVRNLKRELEQDEGSVFRYAAHENTFLNLIYRQLLEDQENIADRDELCRFIQTITSSVNGCATNWTGKRSMIDMCELVKRYYYDPATNGSNSIKQVLPAILNSSRFLQDKYSQPIYGAAGGIPSQNYKDWKWIETENGRVLDPYKLLPKMFQDISEKDFALLSDSDELRDGGAALTAYARMQFEEMTEYERAEIRKALLQYCELDTFAMVMIYEGWKDLIRQ
jgi:hypothetical protein